MQNPCYVKKSENQTEGFTRVEFMDLTCNGICGPALRKKSLGGLKQRRHE